ncbi:MAG: hypothetical protein ACLU80_11290 [Dorea sp.]
MRLVLLDEAFSKMDKETKRSRACTTQENWSYS